MLFNKPNAKKNPTHPWDRKKDTLFDHLVHAREKRRVMKRYARFGKFGVILASIDALREARKGK